MSNWDAIVTSTPLDKTAAMVTRRSKDSDPETDDRREVLLRLVQQVERTIKITTDKEQKKRLGVRKFELQNALREVRKRVRRPDLHVFIVESTREMVSPAMFRLIVADARKKFDETHGDDPAP